MNILDNVIILMLIIGAFISGMKIADKYHREAALDKKESLQRQYLRLQTGMDADDPCQPYASPEYEEDAQATGKFSVSPEFMERLKENRAATIAVR